MPGLRRVEPLVSATGSAPRRESDSDDSAAIDLRQEQEDDLEETVKPVLRSTRSMQEGLRL